MIISTKVLLARTIAVAALGTVLAVCMGGCQSPGDDTVPQTGSAAREDAVSAAKTADTDLPDVAGEMNGAGTTNAASGSGGTAGAGSDVGARAGDEEDADHAADSDSDAADGPAGSKGAPSPDANSYEANMALSFADIPADHVISVEDLAALLDAGDPVQLIDIRDRMSFYGLSIAGAANYPAGQQIVLRADEIDREGTVVLISQGNDRLAEVRQTLIDLDVPDGHLFVVEGGIEAWEAAGLPVQDMRETMEYEC